MKYAKDSLQSIKNKFFSYSNILDLSYHNLDVQEYDFLISAFHRPNNIEILKLSGIINKTENIKSHGLVGLLKILIYKSNLKALYLNKNVLTKDVIESLQFLLERNKNIVKLSLRNVISENTFCNITNKKQIKFLDVRGSRISLDLIIPLTNLIHLKLSNSIATRQLSQLQCINLTKLYLIDTSITDDDIICVLEKNQKMNKLVLSNNKITGCGINRLFQYLYDSNLPLKYLDLSYNMLSDEIIIPNISINRPSSLRNLTTLLMEYESCDCRDIYLNIPITYCIYGRKKYKDIMELHVKNKRIMLVMYLIVKYCKDKFPLVKVLFDNIIVNYLY